MKTPLPKTLLLIEDDEMFVRSLAETAESGGWQVRISDMADEAISLALAFRPTVIFCDVHLARGDGRKVLMKLRESQAVSDCQFVLMTGDWVGASQRTSVELEADAYLPKPFTLEEFLTCLEARYAQANL